MCECYQVGGPFIAEDPNCPVHGQGGYGERLEQAEARIEQLERAIRNELICRSLTSLPLKLEFMRQRGMNNLDEVLDWMRQTSDQLKELVDN